MASERSPHRSFFGSIHRTLLCDSIGVCQHLPRILLIFHFPKNTSLFLYPSASHPSATVGYAHHSTSMPRDGTIRPEKKRLYVTPIRINDFRPRNRSVCVGCRMSQRYHIAVSQSARSRSRHRCGWNWNFLFFFGNKVLFLLLIEPVWNQNAFIIAVVGVFVQLLIEPVWNQNPTIMGVATTPLRNLNNIYDGRGNLAPTWRKIYVNVDREKQPIRKSLRTQRIVLPYIIACEIRYYFWPRSPRILISLSFSFTLSHSMPPGRQQIHLKRDARKNWLDPDPKDSI